MYNMHLSVKKLVSKVKILGLNANSAFLLVIIFSKKIAKIKTMFLTILDKNSTNSLFYYSCNM